MLTGAAGPLSCGGAAALLRFRSTPIEAHGGGCVMAALDAGARRPFQTPLRASGAVETIERG